mmetsp:Transcript_11819/g.25604  ORF Transcript_11819/g.25604 Transcript_11819/m.25604 type:complete len:212 (-) Transcript_11819:1289-1924(-)
MSVGNTDLVDGFAVGPRRMRGLRKLEHNELRDVIPGQAIQNGGSLLTAWVETHDLRDLPLSEFVELNTIRLYQMKLGPPPEESASIDLAGKPHGYTSLLLVNAFVAGIGHGTVNMRFVVIGLDLLQADNVRADINNFPKKVLESKVPRQGPQIAVGVLLLGGVYLGQAVVRSGTETGTAAGPTGGLVGNQVPLYRVGRTAKDKVRLGYTMH